MSHLSPWRSYPIGSSFSSFSILHSPNLHSPRRCDNPYCFRCLTLHLTQGVLEVPKVGFLESHGGWVEDLVELSKNVRKPRDEDVIVIPHCGICHAEQLQLAGLCVTHWQAAQIPWTAAGKLGHRQESLIPRLRRNRDLRRNWFILRATRRRVTVHESLPSWYWSQAWLQRSRLNRLRG